MKYVRALELELASWLHQARMVHTVRACSRSRMSGSDDLVRTARSILLRTVESLGNGSTRPLETNSENTNPQLQLANHDASGGHGVQRETAYESAAISTPTSEATTSAVAERNRLFNFGFCRSSAKRSKYASSVPRQRRRDSVPCPTILFVSGVLPPRNHPRVSK